MARIIGSLGAEKTLIEELQKLGVHSLHSLSDIENHIATSRPKMEALKEAERLRTQEDFEAMKSKHCKLTEEKDQQRSTRHEALSEERSDLQRTLDKPGAATQNPFEFLVQKYKRWRDKKRFQLLEKQFNKEVDLPFKKLSIQILELKKNIDHLSGRITEEVLQRLQPQIAEMEKTDKALDQVRNWIIGARGEKGVVLALSKLPDSFVVINDVVLRLSPPMKSPKGRRFQCQADHVVIGPAGVFNIETKYWSQKSIESLDLRSPVEQVKFTGKALWRDLNRAISNRQIKVNGHHWGDVSIQVRNILAMAGAMPKTDFQYVKMMPVDRLKGYLEYFEPVLTNQEVESIANWFS